MIFAEKSVAEMRFAKMYVGELYFAEKSLAEMKFAEINRC
jgi:hypothetical protein